MKKNPSKHTKKAHLLPKIWVDLQQHCLKNIQTIPSVNQDDRPAAQMPELIVVHGISLPPGQFGGSGVEQLFTNQLNPLEHPYYQEIYQLEVSAHLFIRRDGHLIQFVPFDKRAWHAGRSSFQGRERCNDFSIGIELEGTDDVAYEAVQYQQLAQVIAALQNAYPTIQVDNIVGHSDIAPGRKTDPGAAFCWQTLQNALTTARQAI